MSKYEEDSNLWRAIDSLFPSIKPFHVKAGEASIIPAYVFSAQSKDANMAQMKSWHISLISKPYGTFIV